MAFPLPIPRFHLFEINDQRWFPQLFREKVQACLTLCWKLKAPVLQPTSPATLAASTLQTLLGSTLPTYTFVDFCAGAGGPTPSIERDINDGLVDEKKKKKDKSMTNSESLSESTWMSKKPLAAAAPSSVDFVLTDLFPNIPAWTTAAKRSEHIHFIPSPVNAAAAPPDLLAQAGFPTYGTSSTPTGSKAASRKIFRLYNLAFHHFPDVLAEAILSNTLATADGFAIFELQGRDLGNLFTVLCLAPLLWVGSWYWFWGDWWHLLFTYVVPVVPAVVVFDGLVSCVRTRREGELKDLVRRVVAAREAVEPGAGGALLDGWRFEGGERLHTWPGGRMQYFAGIRDGR